MGAVCICSSWWGSGGSLLTAPRHRAAVLCPSGGGGRWSHPGGQVHGEAQNVFKVLTCSRSTKAGPPDPCLSSCPGSSDGSAWKDPQAKHAWGEDLGSRTVPRLSWWQWHLLVSLDLGAESSLIQAMPLPCTISGGTMGLSCSPGRVPAPVWHRDSVMGTPVPGAWTWEAVESMAGSLEKPSILVLTPQLSVRQGASLLTSLVLISSSVQCRKRWLVLESHDS